MLSTNIEVNLEASHCHFCFVFVGTCYHLYIISLDKRIIPDTPKLCSDGLGSIMRAVLLMALSLGVSLMICLETMKLEMRSYRINVMTSFQTVQKYN